MNIEQIFDELDNVTGWSQDARLTILMEYFDHYCQDKLTHFKEIVEDIADQESNFENSQPK